MRSVRAQPAVASELEIVLGWIVRRQPAIGVRREKMIVFQVADDGLVANPKVAILL